MEDNPISAFRVFSLVTSILLALAVAAPSEGSVRTCGPVSALDGSFDRPVNAARPDQQRFDLAVAYFINIERCRRGLSPLKPDARLQSAAAGHSRNMASRNFFSHKSPVSGKRSMVQRLASVGVTFRTAGENIAQRKLYQLTGRPILIKAATSCNMRYADTKQPVPRHTYRSLAKSAVTAWMKSTGHRRNILNRSFGRIGTGLGINQADAACGTVYLTQDFAD